MNRSILTSVMEQLTVLPDDMQEQVLEFIKALRSSAERGKPGKQLLRFNGFIKPDDLQQMQQAIEDGYEQVDANEW